MSTIKVIAPLAPAGDFALTDAENISLDLVEGENAGQTNVAVAMNRMAKSIENLENEVGMFEFTEDSGTEGSAGTTGTNSSLAEKLNQVDEYVEALFGHVTAAKDAIAECLGYTEPGKTQVYTLLTNTYNALDALIRNIGSAENDEASVRTQIEALLLKLNTLERSIGTEYLQDGDTNLTYTGLYSKIQTLQNYIIDLDNHYDTFRTEVSGLTSGLNANINNLDDKINALGNVGTNITNIKAAVDSLKTTVDSNFSDENPAIVGKILSALNTNDSPTATTARDVGAIKEALGLDELAEGTTLADLINIIGSSVNTISSNVSTIQSNVVGEEGQPNPLLGEITTLLQNNDSPAAAAVNTNLGTFAEGETVKSLLTDLRGHINTMLPPTLTATPNSTTVEANSSPTVRIKVNVNRPIEAPLKLVFNYTGGYEELQIEEITEPDDFDDPRSWSLNWYPNLEGFGDVISYVELVDKDNSNIKYASQKISCTFSAPVYYWTSADEIKTIPDSGVSTKLGKTHPASVTFNCGNEDKYCYYAYPDYISTPTFSVNGNVGGFDSVKENGNAIIIDRDTNYISTRYKIYRSNQKLPTVTVNIK